MTETLTGRQVLALLAQDEVPEIEVESTEGWNHITISDYRIGVLRDSKCSFRIKPAPQRRLSVTLANGEVVSWPEPVLEALKDGDRFFMNSDVGGVREYEWSGDSLDRRLLAFGNVHLTREAAQEHADALRKINTQEATC